MFTTQVAAELSGSVHGTGDVCISLVKAGSAVSGSPDDQSLKRALMDQARIVAEKVSCTLLIRLLYMIDWSLLVFVCVCVWCGMCVVCVCVCVCVCVM